MKGARFILPGCTGFCISKPEMGEFTVIDVVHYKVQCRSNEDPKGLPIFLPMRDFEVLDYPKDEKKP